MRAGDDRKKENRVHPQALHGAVRVAEGGGKLQMTELLYFL
jgi:hypothetical protein